MAQSGSGNPVITAALARMAALRQAAGVDIETLDLFSAELTADGYRVDDIVSACNRLAKRKRSEGETSFPEYGAITAECRAVFNERIAAERHKLALEGAKFERQYDAHQRELSPDEAKAFMVRFKQQVAERLRGEQTMRLVKPEDAA